MLRPKLLVHSLSQNVKHVCDVRVGDVTHLGVGEDGADVAVDLARNAAVQHDGGEQCRVIHAHEVVPALKRTETKYRTRLKIGPKPLESLCAVQQGSPTL